MESIEHLLGKVHTADCMPFMRSLPDGCVDLVITSPPYNLGDNHHTGDKKTQAYADNIEETLYQTMQIVVLNELSRILKPGGSVFYNHKNRIKDGLTISPLQWIFNSSLKLKQDIVWINGGQNLDKIRFFPMTERVYWLTKDGKDTGFYNHRHLQDFVNWLPERTGKEHSRNFPIQYPIDILSCFLQANIIFDPFMGSGTTAVACERLGRKWFGCELEPKYVSIANKRIEAERNQLKLF